jgi:hypothetical protein
VALAIRTRFRPPFGATLTQRLWPWSVSLNQIELVADKERDSSIILGHKDRQGGQALHYCGTVRVILQNRGFALNAACAA